MAFKALPPIDYLRQLFEYDDVNGWLIWRSRPLESFFDERAWRIWNTRFSGKRAGWFGPRYRSVCIDGIKYQEHRIVWSVVTGEDPGDTIDHKNSDGFYNRIENLRKATQQDQVRNTARKKSSSTGYKGAFKVPNTPGRFFAQIKINRKQIYLGTYDTPEEAHEAYCRAAKKAFGEFFNPGDRKSA